FVLAAHSAGAVRAAHDRAEGGLAVALAEIAIRDGIGMRVSLPLVPGSHTRETLFGEGPSAILLVIDPGRAEDVVALAREHGVALWTVRRMGLVGQVFSEPDLGVLGGRATVGHTRYSTTGSSRIENAQPLVVAGDRLGELAIAHNGNCINARDLRDQLSSEGVRFATS